MPVEVTTYVYSKVGQAIAATGFTEDINIADFSGIAVDVVLTSLIGTLPIVQFILERRTAVGDYMPVATSTNIGAINTWSNFSVGRGLTVPVLPGPIVRIRWAGGGTIFTSAVANIFVVGDAR